MADLYALSPDGTESVALTLENVTAGEALQELGDRWGGAPVVVGSEKALKRRFRSVEPPEGEG